MPSSSEAAASVKTPSSLAFYLSLLIISGASRRFWRQHMSDENIRRAARVQETEIFFTGTKTSWKRDT